MKKSILGLFFTRGVSLEIWLKQGLFDREKLLYIEHLKKNNFERVYWFTYGVNDQIIAQKLKCENKLHKDIHIFAMPQIFKIKFLGNFAYSFLLPIINRKKLQECSLYKTNQIDGSWSGIIAAKLYRKRIINRTGYTLSIFSAKKNFSNLIQAIIECVEKFTYRHADLNIVASNEDKFYLVKKYKVQDKKIHVIHNYIDTDLFKPIESKKYEKRLVFVGRLDEQKNLFNLIEAISKTDFKLDIYGNGYLKNELIKFSRDLEVKVNFKGIINNSDLPNILNHYHYYILVSHYEGMPKTLLEAMSCGCVCIGTNVSGIREVIEDRVNGYLSENTSVIEILNAIKKAVNHNQDQRISENARLKIMSDFALAKIVQKEKCLFEGYLNLD